MKVYVTTYHKQYDDKCPCLLYDMPTKEQEIFSICTDVERAKEMIDTEWVSGEGNTLFVTEPLPFDETTGGREGEWYYAITEHDVNEDGPLPHVPCPTA